MSTFPARSRLGSDSQGAGCLEGPLVCGNLSPTPLQGSQTLGCGPPGQRAPGPGFWSGV